MTAGGVKLAVTAYVVAALVALAGIVAGAAFMVQGALDYVDAVEGFQRVPTGSAGTVTLDGTGGYTVYYEAPGANEDPRPVLPVRITDEEGSPVPVAGYGSKVTYDVSGYEGVAIGSFQVEHPGDFEVLSAEQARPATLAVGRGLGRTVVRPVAFGVAVMGLALLVAGAIAIATLLGRARAQRNRRAAAPPAWGAPPPPG